MKDRALIYLSLALSIVSLGYAAWVHQQGSEALAKRALSQREAELVRHWTPKFNEVFKGMGVDPESIRKSPTDLEELFDPLIAILNQVGDTNKDATNAVAK